MCRLGSICNGSVMRELVDDAVKQSDYIFHISSKYNLLINLTSN